MRIYFLLILIITCITVLGQTNTFPADGNVGVGTLNPLERLSVIGGHSNSRIGLHFKSGQVDRDADLLIWASEPNMTYTGVGIGNNVSVNSGVSRLNLYKGGSYIRLLDQEIKLNILKLDGSDLSALTVNSIGYVGIGKENPVSKLDIDGSINIPDGQNITWGGNYGPGIPTIASSTVAGINFYPTGSTLNSVMQISTNGNVLIGKMYQNNLVYKLDVNGKVRANEIVVNSTGADFVFEKDYKLLSLPELDNFVKQHKHLPEIPSSKTMNEQGMGVSEIQTKLLQKVEELTLHLIKLNKKILVLEEALKNK